MPLVPALPHCANYPSVFPNLYDPVWNDEDLVNSLHPKLHFQIDQITTDRQKVSVPPTRPVKPLKVGLGALRRPVIAARCPYPAQPDCADYHFVAVPRTHGSS
jgi:hypothetical protein